MNNAVKINQSGSNQDRELEAIKNMYSKVTDENVVRELLRRYKENNIPLSIPDAWSVVSYNSKEGGVWTTKYEIQDTLLYHTIIASRNKAWAGYDVEYGPFVNKTFKKYVKKNKYGDEVYPEVTISVPQWAKVTVKKRSYLGSNLIDSYCLIVLWDECYGRLSKDTDYPGHFWFKMPAYMLFKVGLSRGLGISFPVECQGYTYEELNGKAFFDDSSIIENIEEKVVKSVDLSTGEIMVPEENKLFLVENIQESCSNNQDTDCSYALDGIVYSREQFAEMIKDKLNNIFCFKDEEEYKVWRKDNNNEVIKWNKDNQQSAEYLEITVAATKMKERMAELRVTQAKIAANEVARANGFYGAPSEKEFT